MNAHKPRGRVKGMAFALEAVQDNSPANSPEKQRTNHRPRTNVHTRHPVTNPRVFAQFIDPTRPPLRPRADSSLSTSSSASVDSDSGGASQRSDGAPSSWLMTSPELSRADTQAGVAGLSAETYAAKQAGAGGVGASRSRSRSRSGSRTPVEGTVGRAQVPKLRTQTTVVRGQGSKLVSRKLERWNARGEYAEDEEQEGTVTRRGAGRSGSSRGQLADLFGLDLSPTGSGERIGLGNRPEDDGHGLRRDLLEMEVGDGRGSMVLVKSEFIRLPPRN